MSGMEGDPQSPSALINGLVFDGNIFHDDLAVILCGGRIDALIPSSDLATGIETIDLAGLTLAPGFIDLQVNGGGGGFFSDCRTAEEVLAIAAAHRAHGTTGLLATIISDLSARYPAALDAIASALNLSGTSILGVHLEGPFLNPGRAGIHDAGRIRPYDAGEVAAWDITRFPKRMITVAPEQLTPSALSALKTDGFLIFAGHTLMTLEAARAAFDQGLDGFTHLFNAMPAMESRAAGPIPAFLEDPLSYGTLIIDGHHLDPAMVRLAIERKATGKLCLITDAMASAASHLTSFAFQGQEIQVQNGRCESEAGTLAGSNLTMIDAVRNAVLQVGLPLSEALRMASLYPADCLGLAHRYGRIMKGYSASLVAFDKDFRVRRTWIDGDAGIHT